MSDMSHKGMPPARKSFLYAEECGMALMQDRKSKRKLAMDKDVWDSVVRSIQDGSHPGAPAPQATNAPDKA